MATGQWRRRIVPGILFLLFLLLLLLLLFPLLGRHCERRGGRECAAWPWAGSSRCAAATGLAAEYTSDTQRPLERLPERRDEHELGLS